jgi:hypothetical protein
MLSDKALTEVHAKVYRKHGYTFQTGLRAFMRGRRWAKNNSQTEVPPSGILDKLRMWASINSEIQKEMIRAKEVEKNAKTKSGDNQPNGDEQANGPNEVSEKSDGN